MKKIWTLLFLCFLGVVGAMAATEPEKPSVSQSTKWNVIVTYNIYHTYYKNKDDAYAEYTDVKVNSQTQPFVVYADTPEEAEREAISECQGVCSRSSGRYIGPTMYNGVLYHAYETRRVYSARATVATSF